MNKQTTDTDKEAVECYRAKLDKFERDLNRKGYGVAPNECAYKLTTFGSTDIPALERTTPAGARDMIVGYSGEQFGSMDEAKYWAIADGRRVYAPGPLPERQQLC